MKRKRAKVSPYKTPIRVSKKLARPFEVGTPDLAESQSSLMALMIGAGIPWRLRM